jgi:glycosyltransferase involved in cell wall biosynthesis
VAAKIDALKPTCLVISGFNLMAMLAARYARQRNIPYIIWSGGTDAEFAGLSARRMRTFIRRRMVRDAAGFIAYGSRARSHLQSLGADPEKISIGINSVDTDFFGRQVAERKALRDREREDGVRVLYVGHLQRRKGLDLVLRALARIDDSRIILDVVGNGPQREEYEGLARELGLHSVRFWGYKGKEELPEFYAAADIFVFPSVEEVFGLVAVEAAAAGLPIVASNLAGGTPDLVEDGRNGYIVDPRNVEEFASRIAALSADRKKREEMGEESLRIVRDRVNIYKSADGFVEAIMRNSPKGIAEKMVVAR